MLCHVSLYLWRQLLKTSSNSCFICQQPKRQPSTITEHMQPWPVWYPNSFLSAIGALGTGCLSCSLNTTALRGYGLAWHKGHLCWEPPLPSYENGGAPHWLYCVLRAAEWRIMGWVQDVHGHGSFGYFLCHSHSHGQFRGSRRGDYLLIFSWPRNKDLIHRNFPQWVELRFYFNKRGCKLMDK